MQLWQLVLQAIALALATYISLFFKAAEFSDCPEASQPFCFQFPTKCCLLDRPEGCQVQADAAAGNVHCTAAAGHMGCIIEAT